MTPLRATLALAFATVSAPPTPAPPDPFEFKDGDRVVLLGSTLVEREQKYGYWELALTLRNRDKNVTFRNLGWSGDTVSGEARASFDPPPKGFERMVELTKELKPTVVVVCFGHNESFAGEAGVGKFAGGLNKLLDALAPTKARVVLMSPTPFEKAGPLAEPGPRNKDLALYRDAIRAAADNRQLEFVDLFEMTTHWLLARGAVGPATLTDNGLHLSPEGYRATAELLFGSQRGEGAEAVRQKTVEKNRLFFYRWRPQNETYLTGFRKKEQGQNAKEVAEFDPLVAAAEKEIAGLKKAVK